MFYALLDTNSLLHFKRPDQIDWPALLKSSPVTLVFAPIVIRELEQQKVENPIRKLKDRAHSTLQWLAKYADAAEPISIRPNVFVQFIRRSPTIDFAVHHLAHTISDDQLIASALEFKSETNVPVTIVTADLGLRLKLREHDLEGVAPAETDRLADEPDEAERELAKLRRGHAPIRQRSRRSVLPHSNARA
jgi:predicted ribonuclease YlaK